MIKQRILLSMQLVNVIISSNAGDLRTILTELSKKYGAKILRDILWHLHRQPRKYNQLLKAIYHVAPELRAHLVMPGNRAIKPEHSWRIKINFGEFATRKGTSKKAIGVPFNVYAQNLSARCCLTPRMQDDVPGGLAGRRGIGSVQLRATRSSSTRATSGSIVETNDDAPFSAFARLNAPDVVMAGKSFNFEVGFGSEPDTKANSGAKSKIEVRAKPGDDMLVIVAAENGTILSQPNHARLSLNLDAKATFEVRPAANALYVRISVEYLFRNEVVGTIVRALVVAGQPSVEFEPEGEDLFSPMMQAIAPEGVDLTLMVKLQEAGKITWQAVDRASGRISNMMQVEIGNARSFAGDLCAFQRKYGDKGFEALQEISVIGGKIADIIPKTILKNFLAPLLKSTIPPRILILTNEPHVPWELAVLDSDVTGKDAPQFLGAIARVGRWWVARRVPIPPLVLKVEEMSAIAADSYDQKTNMKQLPEAKAEQEWLSSEPFHAKPIDGRHAPFIKWLQSLPIGPGHLAHFALHGYAVPAANEQALFLGDGAKISSAVLAGYRQGKEDPRFAMVFLNACQVATAGRTLGQITGFPGDLLCAGTGAVIGPLWEVNDAAAHMFAMSFYEKTYKDKDHVGVSEALRQLREQCNSNVSLTPLAYIYYGHPGLTLSH